MDELAAGWSRVIDIRGGDDIAGLSQDIARGLRAAPKSLPSLLLWDDQGLKLFDRLARNQDYYPSRKETSLIQKNAERISARIKDDSFIVELGSGNIDKTAVLLEALVSHSKAIVYFALDVSNGELERNLARLAGKIPTLAGAIHGLCGTYDDLIRALDGPLARLRSSEVTFLWFGNSFANAPPETSMAFLSNLLARCHGHPKLDSSKTQALVGIDGCRDSNRVLEAYGTRTGVHRDFLFHALHHANEVLGQHVFFREHWDLQTHFDEHSGLLKQNFVAKRNIELLVERKRLQIHKGEEVNICQSGKWDQREVTLVAEAAAIQMTGDWHHEDGDYGIYLLS